MGKIIAYCGLVCSDCPGYIATQANDREALERLAEQAKAEHNLTDITAEGVMCDGCLDGAHKVGYCAQCEIRACGVARGVANCAHCPEYGCSKLEQFLGMVSKARDVLEQIRSSSASA